MEPKTRYVAFTVVVALLITAAFFLNRKFHQSSPKPPQQHSQAQTAPAKSSFIDVTPVVFHPVGRQEIAIPGGDAQFPRVSPDGARIVFVIKSAGKTSLALVELPAGKIAPLPTGMDITTDPSWSADGTKIVFVGTKAGASEIYLYDLKERKLAQVTRDPKRLKSWPRLSPFRFDGHYRIAYTSEEKGRKDIWWVRESGEFDQPVTVAPERVNEFKEAEYWKKETDIDAPLPITTGGECPEWSPSLSRTFTHRSTGRSQKGYTYTVSTVGFTLSGGEPFSAAPFWTRLSSSNGMIKNRFWWRSIPMRRS